MTTREIPLTKGYVTVINEAHWGLIEPFKWCVSETAHLRYAKATINRSTVYMHRLITGASTGSEVDHINHDGLDNRYPENIRICTRAQNNVNRRSFVDGTSAYKGVSWCKRAKFWRAEITVDGRYRFLGFYDNEKDAAQAWNAAAVAAWGEFALLNDGVPYSPAPVLRRLRRDNGSGYRGVCWDKRACKWYAQIFIEGRPRYLGRFDDSWEAAQAWNVAARAVWGESAYQNERLPELAEQVSA